MQAQRKWTWMGDPTGLILKSSSDPLKPIRKDFMKSVQVIDLDGCISNDLWRRKWIKPRPADGTNPAERFAVYHGAAFADCHANIDAIDVWLPIIVFTSRPLLYSHLTTEWLRAVPLPSKPIQFHFRHDDDHRPSVVVKRDMMRNVAGAGEYRVVRAIDDLSPIVEMYLEFGVNSQIVRIGEEEHLA